ncbi:phosphoribosyltransferase [Candidatus Gracilibacteria bacterium]|nr:phosphoribosyltransferase [Candidatus Gracilibacteria bacterium]
MQFSDRTAAGKLLAEKLADFRGTETLVLALPRGGVVVGFEIARKLNTPLEVLVARKLGAPGNPEFGFGAIARENTVFLDEQTVKLLGLAKEQIDEIIARENLELKRREKLYCGERKFPALAGKTVILVDDGIATGVTVKVALKFIRKQNPARIILAVPVLAAESIEIFEPEVDGIIYLQAPTHLGAVGAWYDSFPQNTDTEIIELLTKSRLLAQSQ